MSKRKIALPETVDRSYLLHCFTDYMHKQLATSQSAHPSDDQAVTTTFDGANHLQKKPLLIDQWELTKEEKTYKRCEQSQWFDADLFTWKPKSWSLVLGGEQTVPYFFFLRSVSTPTQSFDAEIAQGQDILGAEARTLLMLEILHQLKTQDAIRLTQSLEHLE